MWKSIILAIAAAGVAAYSQILLKISTTKHHKNTLCEYINRYVIGGYFLLSLSTVLNVLAYISIDYMLGSVFGSLSYVLVVLFAYFMLHERVDRKKVVGILLVLVGIGIYNISI